MLQKPDLNWLNPSSFPPTQKNRGGISPKIIRELSFPNDNGLITGTSMAVFRSFSGVTGELVLCLLAQFSSVLPSFLGSFQVELRRTMPCHEVYSSQSASLFSAVPAAVLSRLSLTQIESRVPASSPSQWCSQAPIRCTPPEQTGKRSPPWTTWGQGRSDLVPECEKGVYKPAKGA